MLAIREQQVEELELRMREEELRFLLDHAMKYYASRLWEMSEIDLLKKMNRMVNTCTRYGITDMGDVSIYVLCAMQLGENFEDNPKFPWAKEILQDTGLTAAERMDELDEAVFGS